MSDTTKETPITPEWLKSVGFLYRSERNNFIRDNCQVSGYAEVNKSYDSKSWNSVRFKTSPRPEIYVDGLKIFVKIQEIISQERLSALWFALTGEELK